MECFRLASSGVKDETQIHSHMCYSEFNDIIESVGELDADVISIESTRSQMELLDAFTDYRYPNEIGPGVYDIHAPRVPSVDEVEGLLRKACTRLRPEQIWVSSLTPGGLAGISRLGGGMLPPRLVRRQG